MEIILGKKMELKDLVNVARYGYKVKFSEEYIARVNKSRKLVEKWVEEEKVMYGITTGFGSLCKNIIPKDKAVELQKNIVMSHSVSVGDPLSIEETRAVMFMILLNAGSGYSGIRIETLERYRDFLNNNITPWAPKEGSVGYLSPEAHIAVAMIGMGKIYYENELFKTDDLYKKLNIQNYELSYKEGLILTNGTTSCTALAALSIYDMITSVKTADIIAAMNLEISKGTVRAYDERAMSVKGHEEQKETAKNLRTILSDSEIAKEYYNYRLQDALSLRATPQAHGAAKKTLYDAKKTIEIEMNSCADNPIIYADNNEEEVISACNCDSGYVGIEMDSSAIAATYLAKISERRNNRLINSNISEFPPFLIKNPGLNSGLMIPQYTQAGLLNDMKILSTPATIDSIPTCADQEDYVGMGYNACKKARQIAGKLEYILAIELLSIFRCHQLFEENLKAGSVSNAIIENLQKEIESMDNDIYLYPVIEGIKDKIHSGELLKLVEKIIGKIK